MGMKLLALVVLRLLHQVRVQVGLSGFIVSEGVTILAKRGPRLFAPLCLLKSVDQEHFRRCRTIKRDRLKDVRFALGMPN
jgi:hypothetical protein